MLHYKVPHIFAPVLLLFVLAASLSDASNEADRTALLSFKNSFPTNTFPNWNTSIDFCLWDHIRCNGFGRVDSLSIQNNNVYNPINITGKIPPSIGDLSALLVVKFSNLPNLHGSIPFELSKLTELSELTIEGTGISGPIPSSFGTLRSLEMINLMNNKLIGTIPPSLGYLPRLFFIYLSGNKLSGTIPSTLFSKSKAYVEEAMELDLYDNDLTGHVPRAFHEVMFFKVNLGRNKLTGDASFLFDANYHWPYEIILAENQLEFNLSNVEYPTKLRYLDLSHNKIYGSISSKVTEMDLPISHFDVSSNMLCGRIPYGGTFKPSNVQFFDKNKCLCGTPLHTCK